MRANPATGERPAASAHGTASVVRPSTIAIAATPARSTGAGTGVVAPTPAVASTTLAAAAQRSTTDRSDLAARVNVTVQTRPSTRSSCAQPSSPRTASAATSTGTRNAPRWNSAPAVAGSEARRRRPTRRKVPVRVAMAASLAEAGISAQRTATKTAAAARRRKAPVPVTQTAPVREGSSMGRGASPVGGDPRSGFREDRSGGRSEPRGTRSGSSVGRGGRFAASNGWADGWGAVMWPPSGPGRCSGTRGTPHRHPGPPCGGCLSVGGRLDPVELGVASTQREQVLVGAVLDHAGPVEHHDEIGHAHRGEAV